MESELLEHSILSDYIFQVHYVLCYLPFFLHHYGNMLKISGDEVLHFVNVAETLLLTLEIINQLDVFGKAVKTEDKMQ